MTPEQEAHLQRQKEHFLAEFGPKWREGAKAHPGETLEEMDILEHARELKHEALDLWAYADSLEEKIRKLLREPKPPL